MDTKVSGLEFNSFKWSCTLGTTGGYDLENQVPVSEDEVALRYGRLARAVYEKTGTYVSAVITKSRTVYHEDWGCPGTGEYSFTLSGNCNPAFSEPEKYLSALKELMTRLKEEWKQATLLMEIVPASVIYLRDNAK